MIVCLCRGVSDRAIRAAREAGASTPALVAVRTGAGTGCGCCRGEIERILAEPCGVEACARCPNRAPDAVPQRIAAEPLKTP